MKNLLLFIYFLLGVLSHISAQNNERITIKAGEDALKSLSSVAYRFDDFKNGKVHFSNGRSSFAKLNYNFLIEEMQFIGPNGDTLSIDNPSSIKKITIGDYQFFYHNGFLEMLEDYKPVKLAIKKKFRILNKNQKGGYGQTNNSSAISNVNALNNGLQSFNLDINEDITLEKDFSYYLIDENNRTYSANKRAFIKAFSGHKKEIENYIKTNKIDFTNEQDLQVLLRFCANL